MFLEPEPLERAPVSQTGAALPPLGLVPTALLFGGASLLLFGVTHAAIPALATAVPVEPVLLWFMCAGLGLLLPLVLVSLLLLRWENVLGRADIWRRRLRFRPMSGTDWGWGVGALVLIGLLAAACGTLLPHFFEVTDAQPSFLRMSPGPGRYLILVAWLPFFVLNIMSEEILWRGVVLPRQEVTFGDWAWLVNGIGWFLFHFSLGPAVLLMLAPTTFILPYVVQRRQNSSIGVLIHAGLNGPAFIAVTFGLA